jgi:S-formylglutathione hydrolase
MAWETAVADTLRVEVGRRFGTTDRVGLVGVSMGGYGALAIAFARSERFVAVSAVAPMIEPSVEAERTPLRNRFHYPPDCPAALVGPQRDADLFRRSHPAARARRHAETIVARHLSIYIDAGSRDAVHAHDGAELLHRVLWDLDVPHAYHLHRDADHVGPTLVPRLRAAFGWVGARLTGEQPPAASPDETMLRETLAPARERALTEDPTVARTYGILPAVGV